VLIPALSQRGAGAAETAPREAVVLQRAGIRALDV
jgi:hypothetical protein